MDMQTQCAEHHGKGWYKLIGRVLLGLVFLLAGWMKLTGFSAFVGQLGQTGFPLPSLFAVLAIIFEFGGALLLISGFHVRLAAWMLIIFTAIATVVYHDPMSNQVQMMMFMKNLAIIGGLLYVAATGAGKYGLAKWNRTYCKGGKMCPDCRVDMEHEAMPMQGGMRQGM